jgi:hypothetical protein
VRSVAILLFAGCGFGSSVKPETTGDIDAPIGDAPLPDDGTPPNDMMPLPLCIVGVTTTPGTDRGRVGGNGGGDNFGPMRCNAVADRIVGIGIRMSNQNTVFGAPSAHGLSIACATVTLDPNTGIGTTGTTYTKEIMGNGNQGWEPSTSFAPTLCPAGMVVSGLRTHTGQDENIFNNVDVRCSKLDGTNAATVMTQLVHVNGSQDEAQNEDTVNCGPNEILYEMSNRTGTGFDSATLFCAPARCLPPAA